MAEMSPPTLSFRKALHTEPLSGWRQFRRNNTLLDGFVNLLDETVNNPGQGEPHHNEADPRYYGTCSLPSEPTQPPCAAAS